METAWSSPVLINYKNKGVAIRTMQVELLNNGWVEYSAKSDDSTFSEVFGKNPISIAIKPKQEFKPEYDLFQNTPEQIELSKEIWDAIQRRY